MIKIFFISTLVIICINSISAREISFTQDDRDRIIRLEEGQKSLQRQIDDFKIITQKQFDNVQKQFDNVQKQFDNVQKQFDNIFSLLLWGFGILFGGMGLLIGFVIWDRRTALSPVVKKNKELEYKEELLERALKEYAKEEPKLAEILKSLRI